MHKDIKLLIKDKFSLLCTSQPIKHIKKLKNDLFDQMTIKFISVIIKSGAQNY